ncbi:MAG: DHH family phosphoesterase, partial [Bacilli bacterium]
MKINYLDTSKQGYIEDKYNLPPFCAKVLASYSNDQISDVLTSTKQPVHFNQMEQALTMINKHLQAQSKIIIVGDYDCDGILATSIIYYALKKLGHTPFFYIPDRIDDGYGLTSKLVSKLLPQQYDLIITVDNGINAKEAIQLALDASIDVIISDHHYLDETKQTKAIYVHPTYSNLDYYISGGLVAFYLASALLQEEVPYLKALAAITLISDVMPLVKGNRLIIREALALINQGLFLNISSLHDGFIDSAVIGNIIAPKINAFSRMSELYNPNQLVKYFNTQQPQEIKAFAIVINECNELRKAKTKEYYTKYQDLKPEDNLLMIEDQNLSEGLIGLLASRFAYQYHCVSF